MQTQKPWECGRLAAAALSSRPAPLLVPSKPLTRAQHATAQVLAPVDTRCVRARRSRCTAQVLPHKPGGAALFLYSLHCMCTMPLLPLGWA